MTDTNRPESKHSIRFKHYAVMWAVYAILFTAALFALELTEGNKITTTEYYGLRNIGPVYLVMLASIPVVLYPVTLMPLTMLLGRFVHPLLPRLLIYAALGCAAGYRIFHGMYEFADGYFIRGYGLNQSTGIWMFGTAGLLYGLADWGMRRRLAGGADVRSRR